MLFPFYLLFRANEGDYGFGIGFGAYDEHEVAQLKLCLAVGDANVAFVQYARANEVAVEEVVYLPDGAPGQVGVGYPEVHVVWLDMGVFFGVLVKLLFLLVEPDVADIPD